MRWSEEVEGMRRDAEKIGEAYRTAYRDGDHILVLIYAATFPFMLLGFLAGEFIGRVMVFLVWKIFELFQEKE